MEAIISAFGKDGIGMNHTLKIAVGKSGARPDGARGAADGIVRCRKRRVRERVLRWLLGRRLTVTILVPGDSVRTVSIVEEAEDG